MMYGVRIERSARVQQASDKDFVCILNALFIFGTAGFEDTQTLLV